MNLGRHAAIVALLLLGLVGEVACTTLLGSFETAGPGGTGGAGGNGGQSSTATTQGPGGAGGAAPITAFGCVLGNEKPIALKIYNVTNAYLDRTWIAERGQALDPWVLALTRSANNDATLTVHSLLVPAGNELGSNVRGVLQVARLTSGTTGVLLVEDRGNGAEVFLYEIFDAAPNQVPVFQRHAILLSGQWSPSSSNASVDGRFVATNATGTDWEASVVVAYRDSTEKSFMRYGHFNQKGGKTVSVTDPASANAQQQLTVQSFFHAKALNRDFAYVELPFMEAMSNESTPSEFSLGPDTMGIVASRSIGPLAVLDAVASGDGANVMLAGVAFDAAGHTLALHAGKLAPKKLGNWLSDDAKFVDKFAPGGELPFGDPAFGWLGDIFAMVGGQGEGTSPDTYKELGFLFLDADGNRRGSGVLPSLPFQPVGGSSRLRIRKVSMGTPGGLVETSPFKLHVAWVDISANVDHFETAVLAYDELVCTEL